MCEKPIGSITPNIYIIDKNIYDDFTDYQSYYIQFYYSYVDKLYALSVTEVKVLFRILRDCGWANTYHLINLDESVRKSIQTELGIGKTTFYSAITHCVKLELLIKHSNNCYAANPFIFARGEYPEVKRCREAEQQYLSKNYSMKKKPYTKLYLDDLEYLNGLTKSDLAVLFSLFSHVQWLNTGMQRIVISKGVRKVIAHEIKFKDETIYKCIRKFLQMNILGEFCEKLQVYQLNPFYFKFGTDFSAESLEEKFDEENKRFIKKLPSKEKNNNGYD